MAQERMPRTSAFRPHAGLQSSSGRPQSVCWAMSHSREISGSATKSAIHLQTSQSVHGVRAQRFSYSISWPAMLIKNSLCKSRAMCVNEDGQSSIEPCESSTLMKEADSTVYSQYMMSATSKLYFYLVHMKHPQMEAPA